MYSNSWLHFPHPINCFGIPLWSRQLILKLFQRKKTDSADSINMKQTMLKQFWKILWAAKITKQEEEKTEELVISNNITIRSWISSAKCSPLDQVMRFSIWIISSGYQFKLYPNFVKLIEAESPTYFSRSFKKTRQIIKLFIRQVKWRAVCQTPRYFT